MINVRKLAAIDLYFLGPYVVVTEFVLGVAGPIVLGVFTLRMASRQAWPLGLTSFGAYLLLLGVNYIPMLLHAISLVRSGGASSAIADELSDQRVAFRKYRRQSLYLLVPFLVPLIAIVQQREAPAAPPASRSLLGCGKQGMIGTSPAGTAENSPPRSGGKG